MKTFFLAAASALLVAGAAHAQVKVVSAKPEPYCREYTQTMTISGKTQKGYGTACLQPDGSWELRNDDEDAVQAVPPVKVIEPRVRYVVQERRVFVYPPEPFVVGTVLIQGRPHHFDRDFRPDWRRGRGDFDRGHDHGREHERDGWGRR